MPREKAYSSFNISGEGSILPKSTVTLKEYADSATRPLFRFLFLFKKKYILNIGSGVVLPAGPVARGHPNGRRASQSHILACPIGQP